MRISISAVLSGCLWLAAGATALSAQTTRSTTIRGRVYDAETLKPVAYAGVSLPDANTGTATNENGEYILTTTKKFNQVRFQALGYSGKTVKIKPDTLVLLDVALSPEAQELKEVTVKPKRYRNKDNPAVELIQLVVENRDKNRVENLAAYQDEQYEKIFFGFGNMPRKITQSRLLKSIRFVWENRDSSKLDSIPIVPFYLQENLIDFYSKNPPKLQKKYIKSTKSVDNENFLDDEGVNKSLQYLYEGVDIYDNSVMLLTNKFISPIANTAPLFYRYYPIDTTVEDGTKIVHLEFYPRNKMDMLLQGDLYIALDSTYPVTRIWFTINKNINLNWVNALSVEQKFEKLPSGKRVLASEDYRMYFGINKRGMGMFGERYVVHRQPRVNEPFAHDTLFRPADDLIILPDARKVDTAYWAQAAQPLNLPESRTYKIIDSMANTPLMRFSRQLAEYVQGGYLKTGTPFEIGPLNSIYAFNEVEGARLRLGFRTSAKMSTRFRLDGNVMYGFRDERWKYGFGALYALPGHSFQRFPYNHIRFSYQKDLRIPGQNQFQPNTLGTSVVRGDNDRFTYSDMLNIQYEKEFRTRFSYITGFQRQALTAAGSLVFQPTDGGPARTSPLTASKMFVELRYAPDESFYQYDVYRGSIRFNYIAQLRYARAIDGLWGGQYNFHELTASVYKFTYLPPFGYNKLYIEAGGVFGKAPYPFLTIHKANPTYFYQQFSYNLMNFMEFVSDRYVEVNIAHHFTGFFLNKIPVLRRLKWREVVTLKVLYGTVSNQNRPTDGAGLFQFPTLPDGTPITYTLERKPYIEAGVGISNILKVVRIDFIHRLNYLDHPNTVRFGVRGLIYMDF